MATLKEIVERNRQSRAKQSDLHSRLAVALGEQDREQFDAQIRGIVDGEDGGLLDETWAAELIRPFYVRAEPSESG